MNRNDFMKTTIVLVVGVLLIAGVVTPIIASVTAPEGSEDSGPSFVNTHGIPMIKLSDYIASHDLSNGNSYSITWSNSDSEWVYAIENGVSSKIENPLRGVTSGYDSMPFVSNVAMMFCKYSSTANNYSLLRLGYVPDSGTGVTGSLFSDSTTAPQSFSITIRSSKIRIPFRRDLSTKGTIKVGLNCLISCNQKHSLAIGKPIMNFFQSIIKFFRLNNFHVNLLANILCIYRFKNPKNSIHIKFSIYLRK